MTDQALSAARPSDAPREPSANLIPGVLNRGLVLASTSPSLQRLLVASGLAVRVAPEDQDEMQALHAALGSMPELDPADFAELHMRTKIDSASARFPGALVIGAQQIVSLDGK
jgi:septum formation protein